MTYGAGRNAAVEPERVWVHCSSSAQVASALVESLVECKDGPSVEDLALSYLASESGPIHDREETVLDGVRTLFMRTGGQGAAWEALEKFLEAVLNPGHRQARRKPR